MFGVSTHCLSENPIETALTLLADITSTVEVMDDGLHYLDSPEILESFSFTYYMHAPSRGVNIASHLEPIRKASVEVIYSFVSIEGDLDNEGVGGLSTVASLALAL